MSTPIDTTKNTGRHPVNVTHLVMGLVFLGIAGSWALRTAGVLDTRQLGWLLPLLLVGAGAVGLVAGTVKGLRAAPPDGAVEPAVLDDAYGLAFDEPALDPDLDALLGTGPVAGTSTDPGAGRSTDPAAGPRSDEDQGHSA